MYHIREIALKNKHQIKKRLVIEFDNPDMKIVGEFLMVDAPLHEWSVLQDVDRVLNKVVPSKHFSGNRCGLDIMPDKTYLYDTFADKEGVSAYSDYKMDTVKLRELILMWRKQHQKSGI